MHRITWLNSIANRLNFSYFLVSSLVLCSVGVVMFFTVDRHFYQQDHYILTQKFETIDKLRLEGDFIDKFGSFFSSGETKLWLISKNQLIYSSQDISLPDDFSLTTKDPFLEWVFDGNSYRGQLFQLKNSPGTFAVLGININHHYVYLRSFGYILVFTTIIASLICGLLGWLVVNKELKPLHKLESRVRTVSTNRLDVRISNNDFPTELLPLVISFNDMLDRLEGDFERLSEFSSDIAHELRTPIANMMTQTHVALSKGRSLEEYQDILVSTSEELTRLSKTISDVLYLAKSEHNLLLKTIESFDLCQVSRDLVEYYELAAEEKSLQFQVVGDAEFMGDKNMIKRAIGNLLSNAVRHSREHSTIKIQIQKCSLKTKLSLTNEGDIIPVASIPHLFERFYRVDKSRVHSSSSGSGLGLPITRSIAQLHNGNVAVVSQNGKTTFTLTLGYVQTEYNNE